MVIGWSEYRLELPQSAKGPWLHVTDWISIVFTGSRQSPCTALKAVKFPADMAVQRDRERVYGAADSNIWGVSIRPDTRCIRRLHGYFSLKHAQNTPHSSSVTWRDDFCWVQSLSHIQYLALSMLNVNLVLKWTARSHAVNILQCCFSTMWLCAMFFLFSFLLSIIIFCTIKCVDKLSGR